MKKLFGFIMMILAALAGCSLLIVDDQVAFRSPASAEEAKRCSDHPKTLSLQPDESQFSEHKLIDESTGIAIPIEGATPLRCPVQHFKNRDVRYNIAFLEFNDKGELRDSAQETTLLRYISAHPKLNVLVFVHGWRNDASIGIEDVRRFHTMTALSANYARQRQKEGEETVPTLGIYMGWRGRLLKEPSNEWLAESWAAWTILNRKPQSDQLASAIGEKIIDIEREVKGENHEKPDRKLLIYSHSLGGNIVLKGLSKRMIAHIEKSEPGKPIRGVGDLVILINPASEAANFEPLQKSIRTHIGIKDDAANANSFLEPSKTDCAHGNFTAANKFTPEECTRSGTSKRLADRQPPILVSLTAAKYFQVLTESSAAWDPAIGEYFSIMQQLRSFGAAPRSQTNSIGNQLPVRAVQSNGAVDLSVPVYGVSHEVELDNSQFRATTYRLAGNLNKSQSFPDCPAESTFMNWQAEAIAKAEVGARGRGWDTYKTKFLLIPHMDAGHQAGQSPLVVNIRHGAARNRCVNDDDGKVNERGCAKLAEASGIPALDGQRHRIPILGEAWDPIWNSAVHANTIKGHGGYLSHTLWCVLNRFALDKPRTTSMKGTSNE